MTLAEFVKQTEGRSVRDEDGKQAVLRLLPAVSAHQLATLQAKLPRPLPAEIRELLAVTRGYENGPLGGIDFAGGLDAFEFFSLFPCNMPIARDGCGDFWAVDVTRTSASWGPIYYVCHDPPVVVYQARDLREFVEEWLKWATGAESRMGKSFYEAVNRVYKENLQISHAVAIQSPDAELRAFATGLDGEWSFFDLRQATTGDGFRWNCRNPDSDLKRHGDLPLFARKNPPPSWLRKLFGGG